MAVKISAISRNARVRSSVPTTTPFDFGRVDVVSSVYLLRSIFPSQRDRLTNSIIQAVNHWSVVIVSWSEFAKSSRRPNSFRSLQPLVAHHA